jgi:flagellar basal body P-ring protein FlgI
VVEILAYYIPFVDNLLDTITTPLAIGGGTLLLTSVLPIDNQFLQWAAGLIIGGGAAATVQSGSVLTRLASSKFTAGIANPVVATGEHAAAFGTSILALFIPNLVKGSLKETHEKIEVYCFNIIC